MVPTDSAATPDADGAGRGGSAPAGRNGRPQRPRTKFCRVDGILLLDKPTGMSSNQALQRVRHLFRAEKGGHTGALDPLATGLLPICFGEATKIAGNLLGASKAYDTVAHLGQVTDTDDAEGQVLRERPVEAYPIDRIDAALRPLIGRIQQRPPIYSALKRGGEPLYAKARRGEVVEIEEREVFVRTFELQAADDLLDAGLPLLRLHVECGSGTYVRSLVRDLGEALGCGAHVAQLRRLWVDPFREPRMWTIEQLEALAQRDPQALQACLLPIEAGMVGLPRIDLTAEGAARFSQGQRLPGVPGPAGLVAVFTEAGTVIGLAQLSKEGVLSPQRLFNWPTNGEPAAD
ncbi:tRNA pseudouridine55 synthase [Pseudoxanthomonas sp. GM95]|uniref:tRNA pseudouridine(55) synthase TruB n=1 Tax=Pseudoxanthomonas sp. GM95 TaxID=1881043 RepID=UPI0008CF2AA2|nr:tRNA pseudouridine(55) synthase TruB [Pseudoxanthomonas sp. GM95]SEK90649.1 tRNA pseudouridine55 synthase [Pseudoxanthomonas sp. GM95]